MTSVKCYMGFEERKHCSHLKKLKDVTVTATHTPWAVTFKTRAEYLPVTQVANALTGQLHQAASREATSARTLVLFFNLQGLPISWNCSFLVWGTEHPQNTSDLL